MVLNKIKCFSKFKIAILFLLFNNVTGFSQQDQKVRFIWTDNSLKSSDNYHLYLLSAQPNQTDTIFPLYWEPSISDTLYFELKDYKNPVYIEFSVDTTKKRSNNFNLIPQFNYNLIEFDDKLEVKTRPLAFDTFDSHAQILYAFLIKLLIELIIAILVAALFRLPARLLFFVFVANIMSFPLVYIPFFPVYVKEIITILLEGLFIFLIGWKRLKFPKAFIVSLIVNVIRFGIFKIVMLIIRFI